MAGGRILGEYPADRRAGVAEVLRVFAVLRLWSSITRRPWDTIECGQRRQYDLQCGGAPDATTST